ncbi:hypothetical protein [Microcoleus vaginatus]|uniref:hypothetical protein n=1 Tax=Microcoleus vaginatus TaxID=119532 RepID=UPI0032A87F72
MSKFQLFDAVSLTEPIALADRKIAPPETAGAIVVRASRPYMICDTGETPVHHLRLKYSLTTKSAIAFPGLGTDVKQGLNVH